MQEVEDRDRNGRPRLSQTNFRVPSSRSSYGNTPGWVEKATKDFLDDAGDTEPGIGIKKLPYTRPQLRETIKRRIMAGSDGGRPGQWSARKAQLVAQAYRRAGGGYRGKPGRAQRSLKKWTSERWTTSDGKPARRKGRMTRYLPAAAWKRLTPAQRRATIAKKLSGDRAGRQFVANTQRAASASKKIRSKTLGPSVEEVSKNPNAPQIFANSSSEENRIVSTEPLEQPFSPNKEKLNEIGNAPSYGSNPPVKPFIPGNLDIDNREPIEKQNGSLALIEPTIIDGSGDEAGMFIIVPLITKFGQTIEPSNASSYFSKTGDHLGKFKSREDAEQYLEWLKDIEEEISYRDKKKPIISMHPIEKIAELAGDGFESRRQSIKNTIKRIADKYMTEKALGPTLRAANSVQIYDPDAIDADNDGLVQDATPWMRPALPSSPIIAGLRSAKNSNMVSQRAMKEAQEFANFVSQHEPELTEMMNGFANKKGSSLYLRGLKNRKKTAESLALKAQRLQHLFDGDLTDSITSMNDPLRYTFESDNVNNYTKDVLDVISALAKKGHKASVTNYWTSGDPYKGVNVMVDHPDGFFYEIQFHTPSSYRLKNKLTPLYEKYRDEKNVKNRQEIYDEMLKLSKGVSIPKDIGKFGEPLSRGSGKADFKPARPGKLIPTPLGLSSRTARRGLSPQQSQRSDVPLRLPVPDDWFIGDTQRSQVERNFPDFHLRWDERQGLYVPATGRLKENASGYDRLADTELAGAYLTRKYWHPAIASSDSRVASIMNKWRSDFSDSRAITRALAGLDVPNSFDSPSFRKDVQVLGEALSDSTPLGIPTYRVARLTPDVGRSAEIGDELSFAAAAVAFSPNDAQGFELDELSMANAPSKFMFEFPIDTRGLIFDDGGEKAAKRPFAEGGDKSPKEAIVAGKFRVARIEEREVRDPNKRQGAMRDVYVLESIDDTRTSSSGMRSIRERIPMKEVLQSTQELDDENNDSKYMQNQVWKNLNEELEKRLLTMDGWDDAQKERIKKQVDNLLSNLRAMRDDWQSMGRRERSGILRRERLIDGFESHPEIDMNIDDIIKQAELRIHDDGTLSFKLPPNPILRELIPGDRNYQDVEIPDRETIQSIFNNINKKDANTSQWSELFESIYQRAGGSAQLAVFPTNGEELPHHSLYLPSYRRSLNTKFPGLSDAIQYRYNDIAARILQHYVGPELAKVKRNENPKIGKVVNDNDYYIHGYLGLMADPHAWREIGQELDKRFEVPPSVILHDVLGHYANGNTFDRHGEWGNILATIALARDKEFWEKLRQIPELADLTDEDREIFIRGLLADVAAAWMLRVGYPESMSYSSGDIKEKINYYDGPIDELLDQLDPPSTQSQGGMSSTRRTPLTNVTDRQLVNLGLQSVDGAAIRGMVLKPSGMSSSVEQLAPLERYDYGPVIAAKKIKSKDTEYRLVVRSDSDIGIYLESDFNKARDVLVGRFNKLGANPFNNKPSPLGPNDIDDRDVLRFMLDNEKTIKVMSAMQVWSPGGGSRTEVFQINTRPKHQRRGLAAEMFNTHREVFPELDLQHSNALSEDGQAFSRAVPAISNTESPGGPDGMSSRRREMTESEKERLRPITLAPDEKVKLQPGTTLVYTDEDDRIIRTELIGPQVARVRGIAGMKLYTDPSPDNQDAVDAQMREWDELYGPVSSPQRQARGRGSQPDRTAREQGRPRTTNEDPLDRILREAEESRGSRGMSSRTDTYAILDGRDFEEILDELELDEREKDVARQALLQIYEAENNSTFATRQKEIDEIKKLLSGNTTTSIDEKTKEAIKSISIKVSSNGVPIIFAQPHPTISSILPNRDWSEIEAPSVQYLASIFPELRDRIKSAKNISNKNKLRIGPVTERSYRANEALKEKFTKQFRDITRKIQGHDSKENYKEYKKLDGTWVQQYVGLLLNPARGSAIPDVEHDILGHFGTGRGFDRHGEWANAMAITSFILDSDLLDLTEEERDAMAFWWLGEYGVPQIFKQLYLQESEEGVGVVELLANIRFGEFDYAFDGSTRELIALLDAENTSREGVRSASTRSIKLTEASPELLLRAEKAASRDRSEFVLKSTLENLSSRPDKNEIISGMSSRTGADFIPQKDRLRLTGEQRQQIAELNARGLPDIEIARELGISKESVIRVRKKENIPPVTTRVRKNRERDKKIISMVKQGMTHTQIAEELGIHKQSVMSAVLQHAKETGENYSSFDARDIPRRNKIIELNKLGKNDAEIARELGVSPNMVGRIRRQEGLSVNFSDRNRLNSSD